MNTFRRITPLGLAVLFLGFSACQLVHAFSLGEWRNASDEMVTKWENHVQPLREALPSGLVQVGYVDDSYITSNPAAFDGNEFQLMQYSLAPAALDPGFSHEWIIGNFKNDAGLEVWLMNQVGPHETQTFGFGLYLIHDLGN